ncbi:MAG: hypothetical protein CL573_05630 [Alphaproteobacteria bacterium]|nr:hypothetical protein [Alphaproteobacteria bacterium]HCP00900.1 hypothetical protein [Rhodospirillaceae bacterium]|tara:strand:+ start:264 stop:575 length:312 start_codon:yes stop_codon:yes gene_type:complete
MKVIFLLVLFLSLAACAGGRVSWLKEGMNKEQVRTDQSACRAQAERGLGRSERFIRDIRGSTRGGHEETRSIVSKFRDHRAARSFERAVNRCMAVRGYVHRKS